jgi:hypothetical protein
MTSQGLSEIELGGIVLVCFLDLTVRGDSRYVLLSYQFSKGNTIETMYHVLPHRVPDCKYCQVEQRDPRDRWQVTREEADSCQPIKAVRWLVHLEHEGTSG